jgi:hypothetical protein
MSSDKQELSEMWFEEYLRSTGHDGWQEHHPDPGIEQRPDYRVQKADDVAICEVKEFRTSAIEQRIAEDQQRREQAWRETGISRRPRLGAISSKERHKAVRRQIQKAASQMKALSPSGTPLMIVLANPNMVRLPFGVDDVALAMYGDATLGGSVDVETGAMSDVGLIEGYNGELTNNHPYISAVVLLRRGSHERDYIDQWWEQNRERLATTYPDPSDRAAAALAETNGLTPPQGGYFYVEVLHTKNAITGRAVRVPPALFDGPHDAHWSPDRIAVYSRTTHR